MEEVAQRAVVEDHDLAKVWLDEAYILDVRVLALRAVVSVVARREELSLRLEPVYHRICVLLHRGCKDYELVPLRHLSSESAEAQADQEGRDILTLRRKSSQCGRL
jgi:hypothetical protein